MNTSFENRATKPAAKPAHEVVRERYERFFKTQCRHPGLVEKFIEMLEGNRWRTYRFDPTGVYSFQTDSSHIVKLEKCAPKDVYKHTDGASNRPTLLYRVLKSGPYGFASWREFGESLRELISGVWVLTETDSPEFEAYLMLRDSHEMFKLSIVPYVQPEVKGFPNPNVKADSRYVMATEEPIEPSVEFEEILENE